MDSCDSQTTITAPIAGAWDTAAIPSTIVSFGTRYWIAVLGPAGAGNIRFRDSASGGEAQTNAQSNLSALPQTWTPGTTYSDAPMSVYAG